VSDYLKQESGGKTKVILVSRVHKEASDERMLKLVDEYNFIESIPDEFKNNFPKIIYYGVDGTKAFYEMEHHDLPTIRRLILSNEISEQEILDWTDRITEFSLRMYKHKIIPMPDNYFQTMHFERLANRLAEVAEKSSWFKETLQQPKLIINDKQYLNIPVLAEKFKSDNFIQTVLPEFVGRWSHSDLHYSNILIDRKNDQFILIDPRGYNYCDYYYDFGKLWHSVNGKYEMIASRQFEIFDNGFKLFDNQAYKLLDGLKKTLPSVLHKYSNESAVEVMRKTEWNEVMHFCSLIPFLLDHDGIDARSKVAYYTSTILINEYCEKYGVK
jgi:hypothetical protein